MKLNKGALTLGLFSLFVCTASLTTSAKAQDLTAGVQANGNDANGRDHACSLRTLRFIANGDLITSNFVIVKHAREIIGVFTALGYTVTFDSKKQ
jgi:hypothetical protein